MAGQRQPIELVLAKGNKHLTKAEIESRRNSEIGPLSGEEKAGKLHFLACKRHLDDLKRQKSEDFPYYWSPERAAEVLEYAETLTIAEGDGKRYFNSHHMETILGILMR